MVKPLGELGGTDRSASPDSSLSFSYFGEPMRTHPGLSELALVDFKLQAEAIQVPDGMDFSDPDTWTEDSGKVVLQAISLARDALKRAIHPDDFDRFWEIALAKGQTSEDLTGLLWALVGVVAERPTQRSSGSSTGRRGTKKKSRRDLPSRVKRRYEKQGRPDRAEMVLIKMEHDRAQASA